MSRYPAEARIWTERSNHGLAYLADHIWDAEHGGFHWGSRRQNPIGPSGVGEKHLYGHAFCTYAAAANYQTRAIPGRLIWQSAPSPGWTRTPMTRPMAAMSKRSIAFNKPLPAASGATDALGTPVGQKSMNTHIHILGGVDRPVRGVARQDATRRLEEVFLIVRDKVATPPGHLHLYFQADWTPAPRRDFLRA